MITNVGLFLILLVVLIFVSEAVSESHTKTYGGYVFTSPGLSAYKRRDEAKILCAQNGSKLLEIKSNSVQAITVQFLSDTGIQFTDGTLLFTNGIRDDSNSWNWVNGRDMNSINVYDQGDGLAKSFGYIKFNTNPSGLYISAGVPTDMKGYICQVTGEVDCTSGFSRNGSCFQSYSSSTVSWFDARNRCLNDGGDLASFDFINDDQELNSTLYGSWLSSFTTYWIGTRRQWWTWQNLEASYTNWMNGRPLYLLEKLGLCLCLSKSGIDWKWIECNCNSAFPFVCLTEQTPTPSTSSSTTQITSTVSTTRTTTLSGSRTITTTYSNQSFSEPSSSKGSALGIGLGVGIGGALVIAAIIIAAIFVIRKRGCPRWFEKTRKSNPPDVTLHQVPDHYAEIPNQTVPGNNPTLDTNQSQSTSPVVYAELEIVTGSSPSHENDSISLLTSSTATLSPPKSHKTTTHFTVDGQEYAEVKDVRM